MADRVPDLRTGLRPLRLRAMMTQEELALKSGVGTRTVRDIESGKVRPQPRTLRLLVEALGLGEPDRATLTGTTGRFAVPRELPRVPTAFAGREAHLDALLAAVEDGAAIVAVEGMAGIGKTSLAVRAAHALASRYPDGQLFVNLRGFTGADGPRPELASVLARLLRSLGVEDQGLFASVDELTGRYRSAVAGRRVLVVLDDAANAEEVEALLPGTTDSLVLATSRRVLSPLAGACSVPLGLPPMWEAVAMLGAAATGRISEEEAVLVADRCGRLPLAMGLAMARFRSRSHWRAADLLRRLGDDDRLLDELDMGRRGVAAALNASYLELDAAHRRLLCQLALVPGDDVDARVAAVHCDIDDKRAASMLESLADVHLVETRSPGRFRLHDLVRLFAARLARREKANSDLDESYLHLLSV